MESLLKLVVLGFVSGKLFEHLFQKDELGIEFAIVYFIFVISGSGDRPVGSIEIRFRQFIERNHSFAVSAFCQSKARKHCVEEHLAQRALDEHNLSP